MKQKAACLRQPIGCEWTQNLCHPTGKAPKACEEHNNPIDCYENNCDWMKENKKCTSFDEQEMHSEEFEHLHDELEEDDQHQVPPPIGDSQIDGYGEMPPPDCEGVVCQNEPTLCPEGEVLGKHDYECCKRCGSSAEVCEAIFEEDKCTDKCQWNRQFYFCGALGGEVPCNKYYEENECDKAGCDWHQEAFMCTTKGEHVPCDRFFQEKDCASAPGNCEWYSDIGSCYPKGKQIECEKFFSDVACNAQDDGRCEYDLEANVCKNAGAVLSCDKYYSDSGCQSGGSGRCVWYEAGYRCLDKSEKLPCDALVDSDGCSAASGCIWDTLDNFCHENHSFEALPCREHNEERGCRLEDGCDWIIGASICAGSTDQVECSQIYDEDACNTHSHNGAKCEWSPRAHACHDHGKAVPCERFYDEECVISSKCPCARHHSLFLLILYHR